MIDRTQPIGSLVVVIAIGHPRYRHTGILDSYAESYQAANGREVPRCLIRFADGAVLKIAGGSLIRRIGEGGVA